MLGFTETVLRDANQSLAATRMRQADFESILTEMDSAGYYSVECWGGATFDSCIRYLNEDPWERLRFLRKKMPNTKLQMLLRGQNLLGYSHYPTEIVRDFVKASIRNGIDIIRIFDALNDIDNIRDAVKATLEYGGHPSCAICYTTSPVHTVDGFVSLAKEMEQIGAKSICIKDMSGCLMPDVAYDLVKALKQAVNVPIILHTHCTSGVAQMTCLKAIEAGVDVIDTAISSFSGGTSQPATETMHLVADGIGVDSHLKLDVLNRINKHFQGVFDDMVEHRVIDYHSLLTNPRMLINQVPGGMYSNLLAQLAAQDISDKLNEVLDEVPRVRKDMGYPPLVTPLSQMVGTQAVANVVSGERYSVVLNEIKAYVRGDYGKSPAPVDEAVREKILSMEMPPQNAEKKLLHEKKIRLSQGYSQEDMLMFVLFPQLAKKFITKRSDKVDRVFSFTCTEHTSSKQEHGANVTDDDALKAIFSAILADQYDFEPSSIAIKKIKRID